MTFKRYLMEEIDKKKISQVLPEGSADALYEVQGSMLEYSRGSGAARFIIGFGVGNAKAAVALRLVEKKTGTTVFGGNFTGVVSSGLESGDQIFKQAAVNFASELQ